MYVPQHPKIDLIIYGDNEEVLIKSNLYLGKKIIKAANNPPKFLNNKSCGIVYFFDKIHPKTEKSVKKNKKLIQKTFLLFHYVEFLAYVCFFSFYQVISMYFTIPA